MDIDGFVEYQRREFCKDIRCPVQLLLDKQTPDTEEYAQARGICMEDCVRSTYEFHHWLIEHGYLVVKPQ